MRLVLLLLSAMAAGAGAQYDFPNRYYTWKSPGDVPPPRKGKYESLQIPSACDSDKIGQAQLGFQCMHMAMLSDDMVLAAQFDQLGGNFVYAVAGKGTVKTGPFEDCGKCYQVEIQDDKDSIKRKHLIIQVINKGGDVDPNQFDIFMAAGGMGLNSAVNIDCTWDNQSTSIHHCDHKCSQPQFKGTFKDWTHNEFLSGTPDGICYAGGLRLRDPLPSRDHLYERCTALNNYDNSTPQARMLFDSCIRTHDEGWRQTFFNTKFRRVQCPQRLYQLTGLHRTDEGGLPKPDFNNPPAWHETCGDGGKSHVCITTMHDGCPPACAWDGDLKPPGVFDTDYPRVDRCNQDGSIAARGPWYNRRSVASEEF